MKNTLIIAFYILVTCPCFGQQLSSNLPIFVIESDSILDEPKVDATLKIYSGATTNSTDDLAADSLFIGIETRGRSSLFFDKKSYGFETRNTNRSNRNVSILGFPKENDWVLYGPYSDKSLIRNALTYSLYAKMGWYSPRIQFCEVIINDKYKGVYLFTEKVKRSQNRVQVESNNAKATASKSEYLIEINHSDSIISGEGWQSTVPFRPDFDFFTSYFYQYPKAEDLSERQKSHVKDWITRLELSLKDTTNDFDYADYIDLNSWVDYVIINELSKDVDAYSGSTFLTLKDGKIQAGPVWDHNLSYGNCDYCGGQNVEGFAIGFEEICQWKVPPLIFGEVWKDMAFKKRTAQRWMALRNTILSDQIFTSIDSLAFLLEEPAQRNFERWPLLGTYTWPNAFVGDSYQSEIDYLKSWIRQRIQWLDQSFFVFLNEEDGNFTDARIAPNPNKQGKHAALILPASIEDELDVKIYNSTGKYIAAFVVEQGKKIKNIPIELSAGTYFIQYKEPKRSSLKFLRFVVQ